MGGASARGIRSDFEIAPMTPVSSSMMLDAGPVIVVGYSMGGTVAQLLWRRHPDLVGGLVLCATSSFFSGTMRERTLFSLLGGASMLSRALPRSTRAAAAFRILSGRSEREIRGWARGEIDRHDWLKVAQAGRALGRFDSRRWIGGVDVPTAQILTSYDEIVPLSRQQQLADALTDVTTSFVPGGHSICIADPEVFVPALIKACDTVAEAMSTSQSTAWLTAIHR